MPTVKPSAGAMRAAQKIYEVASGVDLDHWAAIIDTEMRQERQDRADLREALSGWLVAYDAVGFKYVDTDSESRKRIDYLEAVVEGVRAILARIAPREGDEDIVDLEKAASERTQAQTSSARAFEALSKINEIRNNIIGLQKMDWSEHVYPTRSRSQRCWFQGYGLSGSSWSIWHDARTCSQS